MKLSILKTVLFIALPSLSLLVSCGKSNPAKSKVELITASSWKYSTAGVDQDANGTVDLPLPTGTLATCDTDNVITFKSDNTGVVDEGATKCSASLPQTNPFTWSLKNNDTDLNISTSVFAGIGGDAKIIELTDSKFTLSKQITMQGIPFPVTVIVTLVH